MATLLGSLCLSIDPVDGWRTCFYIGAAIAFSSSISRRKLKETKEFLDHIKGLKPKPKIWERYFERRNFFSLMGLNMICPTAFYFAYSYGSDLLKNKAGLEANLILFSNSLLLLIEIFFLWGCARLAYRYNPFHILKVRTVSSFILIPCCFGLLWVSPTHATIFLAQLVVLLSTASFDPATPIVIRSFGIQSRFSRYSKAWAFAKAFMYLSTGYLTYWLDSLFGMWGVLGLLMMFSSIFLVSLYAFVPQDKMLSTYIAIQKKKAIDFEDIGDLEDPSQTYSQKQHLRKWMKDHHV